MELRMRKHEMKDGTPIIDAVIIGVDRVGAYVLEYREARAHVLSRDGLRHAWIGTGSIARNNLWTPSPTPTTIGDIRR